MISCQNLIVKGSNQRNENWTGSSAVGGRKLEATMVISKVIKNFIDIENLKKNKRATGRSQDLSDVENLE